MNLDAPIARLTRRCLALSVIVTLASFAHAGTQATTDARLLRSPAIHGDTIVFRYAGDLWVTKLGSTDPARRLTSHPGSEDLPKISADGKWVAFNGMYDGANDIYVMPIEGGEPKRLTFDGGGNHVLGWAPDGKIAYASNYGNFTRRQRRLWFVSREGGLPIRTPIAEVTHLSFLPDGQTIAYMRNWPSNWRRYRGGAIGRISLYNLATNAFSELPQKGEQNLFPLAVGKSIYFVSDKNHATLNLYRYDLDSKKETQITRFTDADVRGPSTDGKSIAWERDGYLEVLDIASGKVKRQSPRVLLDATATRPTVRNLAEFMNGVSISPSGTRLAVEARGEIFSVPVKSGDTLNLTRTSGVREQDPNWSPDGKTIAYISDASGEAEVYTRPQASGEATRLTNANGSMNFTGIRWAPDSKLMEVRTISNDLYILDTVTKELKHVAKQQNSSLPASWSPDSKWLAFVNEGLNRNGAIYLYEVPAAKLSKVTEGYYSDNSVAFDKNGKYLYIRSTRSFTPGFGRFEYNFSGTDTERLFVVPLTTDLPNPLRASMEDDAKPEPDRTTVRIDLAGFEKRMIALPIPAGNQWELNGVKDGVTYLSAVPGTGNYTFFKFDLASRKAEPVYTGPSGTLSITPDGSKLAILSGTTIRVMDLKGGGGDGASKPDTSGIQALIDPRQEWRQIFWDSWRFLRDDFYDPAMGGLDWRAIGKRYEAYLPYVAHRSDLNTVLSMMNNELGTSHAYVGDGDLGPSATSVNIGHLGADYQIEGNHIRLAKIYYGEAFEDARRGPLGEPGFRVDEGSYLLEIDGIPVTSKIHPDSLLVGKANRYVTLTVNSTPSLIGAKKVRVQTVGSEDNLRYYDWIETTRQYVNKASGGRIGFVHVPSVLHDGAAEFMRGFYGQTDKDALIVDERWNVGGYFIQQLIVEMLNRKILIGTQFRNIQDSSSIRALDGPKVMLINEYAGSGGDSFPWAFRAGGAGKLIGRRTMGALVGVNNTLTLIDGGYVTAPDMGVYDPKTGLLIAENVGVPPDIEVDMRPDLVAQGKDPQLDAAIKHLMDELAKLPKKQPRKDVPRVQPHGRVGG